jgi:uncharacterized protein (DUF697 family)
MASQTTSSNSAGTPGSQLTRWLDHVRDRINLNAIDAHARKPVRLILGGPRADALAKVLDPEGEASGVLELADARDVHPDAAVRAFVFCRSVDDPDDAAAPVVTSVPTFVVEYSPIGAADGKPISTAPAGEKPEPGSAAVYRVSALDADELRKHFLHDVVVAYAGLEVALGAALPVFRPTVAAKLTLDCAVTCLKIAAASALADHVPILGLVLGGIASAGDTVALTGLQINMLLNIAAAFGKKAEFARVVELLPVIGGGYGWRTLARELSGFIPFAGIPIKAGIAYAGTLVVGHAAAYYYEHGKPLAADKTHALYYDALARAKKLASEVIDRARRRNDPKG